MDETQPKTIYANFRDARFVQLLKVEVNEGNGADDPFVRVAYFVDPNTGKVLFKLNEYKERKFAGGDQMFEILTNQ